MNLIIAMIVKSALVSSARYQTLVYILHATEETDVLKVPSHIFSRSLVLRCVILPLRPAKHCKN
jgi:hypothetical protein